MIGRILFLKNVQWKKKFILKYIGLLGSKFSNFFSQLSYLIKSSQHFRKNAQLDTKIERYDFYDSLSNKEELKEDDIVFLEFGVYQGQSFKWWLALNNNPNSQFVGFDTFQGLPEDWNKINPKEHFQLMVKFQRV